MPEEEAFHVRGVASASILRLKSACTLEKPWRSGVWVAKRAGERDFQCSIQVEIRGGQRLGEGWAEGLWGLL